MPKIYLVQQSAKVVTSCLCNPSACRRVVAFKMGRRPAASRSNVTLPNFAARACTQVRFMRNRCHEYFSKVPPRRRCPPFPLCPPPAVIISFHHSSKGPSIDEVRTQGAGRVMKKGGCVNFVV